MKTIVFFLEKPSAREMLEGLLPRILPEGVSVRYLVYKGKQDLEKNLVAKLRGWQAPDSAFLVMRDQDSGNCTVVKNRLQVCRQAGKQGVVVRVACHELESFYLGDLQAVENALAITGLARQQENKKFRLPDQIGSPSLELERLTKGVYQKISGSRAIGRYLVPDQNRSPSFLALVDGIRKLTGKYDCISRA